MKVAACGKWFDYLNMMPLQEGLILERLVEEYSDTEVLPSNFQADIVIAVGVLNNSVNTDKCIYEINSVMKPGGILLIIETVEDVPDILITQSFMMTEPKDQRKATNTMFLNRKQWLEILEENGFCNSEEFPGYGEYLEVLGQKLFYCTKE